VENTDSEVPMTRRAVWRFTTALMAFGVVLLFGSVVTYGKPINAGATVAMAYTSFLTHRAIDTERKAAETPSVAPSARPRVRHA
jgi:hypothetical protein